MLVFFSGRRLKPGQYDEFRKAWGGDSDEAPEGLPAGSVVYHARSIKDEDEVISFGIIDIDRDSIDVVRGSAEEDAKRTEEISKHVHHPPLHRTYQLLQ